ncbi:hypothetical protein [Paenibacillus sedimenti]|uniref:Uncharacterized protein n=1 Tax=Paenibacillus sedimenti TaxID=2770274 RepID=A0A926KZ88_9BACL|nr:hypothetical protein [Paenibacillus sedimenti]MBD0384839.1 hypothetical protein [Paenibacillus sedimenti]
MQNTISPQTGLEGPFLFNANTISAVVTSKAPGNYALGRMKGDIFEVSYVGRSDIDLGNRIKDHLFKPYTHFKASYASSSKTAYEKECKNFHDFGGTRLLDNEIHPDRPVGTHYRCPVCHQ